MSTPGRAVLSIDNAARQGTAQELPDLAWLGALSSFTMGRDRCRLTSGGSDQIAAGAAGCGIQMLAVFPGSPARSPSRHLPAHAQFTPPKATVTYLCTLSRHLPEDAGPGKQPQQTGAVLAPVRQCAGQVPGRTAAAHFCVGYASGPPGDSGTARELVADVLVLAFVSVGFRSGKSTPLG